MDTTDETSTTRRDAIEHDVSNATDDQLVVSVQDAAEILSISAGAVRKRIARGSLPGQKIRGQWRVFLNQTGSDETTRQVQTGRGHEYTTRQQPDTTDAQPFARQEIQAQQMAVYSAEVTKPLIERIEDLNREIGQVIEQRDTAYRDRERAELESDALSDELQALKALMDDQSESTVASGAGEPTQTPIESPEEQRQAAQRAINAAKTSDSDASESFWGQLWRHLK